MAKEQKIIAEGKFRIEAGDCENYSMLCTDEINGEEMEDRLAALNHEKGKLIFVRDS